MDSSSEASSMAQGLRIVRLVADREKWGRRLLGVSQLASELDMEQSRVSRLTQELCDLGLLERVERGPFRTGQRFFSLAASFNTGWIRESRTELEALVASFGLRSRISVRVGYRATLLRASSNDALPGSFVKPGMVTPAWCTGSGRALLWDHNQAAIQELLKDVNFIGVGGPGAAHSPGEVSELMDRDRARDFILAAEEFEHGVYELAVPVRSPEGTILASLSVLGSRPEIEPRAGKIAKVLAEAANRLGTSHPGPEDRS
ncbi:IclR family transcriptional regulator [Arthrobacter bambusae]|uniref:IclR family transcriptional regulator n=1 Tax=Arthrobacter bambusae TaxID=1338426 RepID=UPI0027823C2D|nr:IclR family transcriptional regulator C-terminal domain-containing protein [Arthrobacter bambusae]MDQ0030722.1 DNA-binding IclR family transcriptional regulator [Arthrobacter bambusae]MDQ0098991.1 DNA-binding IclR family transcriptional regulator [Arthrobacter bambusae]